VRFGFSTAGESHGPAEVALVHGVPAGLRLLAGDVNRDLSRRQKGYGRGGRQKIEKDEVEFLGGVRHGYTLGSPVAMLIRNRDYANWKHRMTPEPVEDPPQKITLPRPGHADLAGMQKYDFDDLRNVLERSSARETSARVAARDALGGEFVVVARGCPAGLGSYVDWRDKLDARLAAAMMSINAIKGVEFGMGFELAAKRSSEVQDEILSENGSLARNSNRLGGFEGGMTNGEPVVIAAAMKPISTIAKALRTVDLATGEPTRAFKERADSCAVPAAAVIGESMAAIVLAEAFLEKFGMDNMTDIRAAYDAYTERVESTGKRR
jgi:chorismate synthase